MPTDSLGDPPTSRHHGRPPRRIAAIALACAAGLAAVAMAGVLPNADAAHLMAGPVTVVTTDFMTPLTSGGSSTPFIFKLPNASVCSGDSSANAGYRLQSFLVPESVELDTLRFDSSGPLPVTGQFRTPFYDTGGTPYVSRLTAMAVPAGGPGPIIQPLPTFDFAVFDTVTFRVTPGVYKVGIACTRGPADSPTQLDKYWSTVMTITADPTDPGPADIRFVVGIVPPPTTTTTVPATTTTVPAATTTTVPATTTTVPAATTTTVPATTTTVPATTTTTVPATTTTVPATTTTTVPATTTTVPATTTTTVPATTTTVPATTTTVRATTTTVPATTTTTVPATTTTVTATTTTTVPATTTTTVPSSTTTSVPLPVSTTTTVAPAKSECRGEAVTIVGTSGDDDLVGTSGRDVIVGLGGNDRIWGLGGDDVICGGAGDDRLIGGSGADRIIGGQGSDFISGDAGADQLSGSDGDDIIRGGIGDDRLDGRAGIDQCRPGAGNDVVVNCEDSISRV